MSKTVKTILLFSVTLIYTTLTWLVFRPTLHYSNPFLWIWIASIFLILGVGFRLITNKFFSNFFSSYLCFGIAAILLILCGGAKIFSLNFFHKTSIENLIKVEEGNTAEYKMDQEDLGWISETAARKIAFEKFQSRLTVVGKDPLYKGMIQFIHDAPTYVFQIKPDQPDHKSSGFILVDMKTFEAEFVETSGSMSFGPEKKGRYNISRHIKETFPTAIIGASHLEIDENMNPVWVTYGYIPAVKPMGEKKVSKLYLTDAVTGIISQYKMEKVPDWVDYAYSMETMIHHYDLKTDMLELPFELDPEFELIPRAGQVYAVTNIRIDDHQNAGVAFLNPRTGIIKQYAIQAAATRYADTSLEKWNEVTSLTGLDEPMLTIQDGKAYYVSPFYNEQGKLMQFMFMDAMNPATYATGKDWDEALYNIKENVPPNAIPVTPTQAPESSVTPEVTPNAISSQAPEAPVSPEITVAPTTPPVSPDQSDGQETGEGVNYMLFSGFIESYEDRGDSYAVKLVALNPYFFFSKEVVTPEILENGKQNGITFQYPPEYEGQNEIKECVPVIID